MANAAWFLLLATLAPQTISIPTEDGGVIEADLYGSGEHGIVLAHGGRFNKESWAKQAEILQKSGFRVLAINYRGYGKSTGPGQKDIFTAPLYKDVLAAVRYLRDNGAKRVSLIGGSMGGAAAADAIIHTQPGEIDALIGLGSVAGNEPPEKLKGRKLFILTRDDRSGSGLRLPGFQSAYDKVPEPKQLLLLEGSAHAQFLFDSEHADRVMNEILRFLKSAPSP